VTEKLAIAPVAEQPQEFTEPSGHKHEAVWRICVRFLTTHHIAPDLGTLTWKRGEQVYTSKELGARVWREASDFPKDLFIVTLSEIIERLRNVEIEKIRARLLDDEIPPDALAHLQKWLRLVTHSETTAEEIEYYT